MAISNVQLKDSWYIVFDENSKKIKDAPVSSLGTFHSTSGTTILFKKKVG